MEQNFFQLGLFFLTLFFIYKTKKTIMSQLSEEVKAAVADLQVTVDKVQAGVQIAINNLEAKILTGASTEELQEILTGLKTVQADVASTSTDPTAPVVAPPVVAPPVVAPPVATPAAEPPVTPAASTKP